MARMPAVQRRRQLLEVAAKLFAEHGYRGATTAQLAAAAGITEPILYRHFENKLDLFVTLIEEVGREVLESWEAAIGPITPPHRRLRALLEANPATHERGKGVYRVIFQAMTESDQEPRIATAIRDHIAALHAFVKREVLQLQKAGVVRDDEPASALAWLLINVAVGYGMVSPLHLPRISPVTGRKAIQRLLEELITA